VRGDHEGLGFLRMIDERERNDGASKGDPSEGYQEEP